jgi:hypothetical protein
MTARRTSGPLVATLLRTASARRVQTDVLRSVDMMRNSRPCPAGALAQLARYCIVLYRIVLYSLALRGAELGSVPSWRPQQTCVQEGFTCCRPPLLAAPAPVHA